MSEDRERAKPDGVKYTDEGDDVEAHGVKSAEDKFATEEPPDVEAHNIRPNIKPKAKP